MFKFLRKYNKWILAVGGTLLMIVFLIPQALEGLGQTAAVGRQVSATLGPDGRERVMSREWLVYREEADVIRRLEQFGLGVPWIDRIDGTEHWFLLVREAKEAGLIANPRSLVISQEQMDQLVGLTGVRSALVLRAMTNLDGVGRLLQMYHGAGPISDRRMRQFAARVFHLVEAEMIVIAANADNAPGEPTDEQIRRQFEQFRDVVPGEGEIGFGYRLPHRAKVEWIGVTADNVRSMIEQSDEMDGVALRRHWRLNPDDDFPPVESGQPVPDIVRQDLLQRLVEETLDDIARFAHDTVRARRRGLDQRRGYYVLPEDWAQQRQSLPELAEAIQRRFHIQLPEYRAVGDRWLTMDELDELNGITRATTDLYGRRALGLRDLTLAARELDGSAIVQMQKGVVGPVLRRPDGSVYLFRITDVDPTRPPHTVDEVRDMVVKDLRRLSAYEKLKADASRIESLVAEQGMLGLSLEFDTEVLSAQVSLADQLMMQVQMQQGQMPTLTPTPLPALGVHQPTSEAIIDRARQLPFDRTLREMPADQRTFVLPVDDRLSIVVARVTRQFPLSEENFRDMASLNLIRSLLITQELGGDETIRNTFSLEALAERHNFKAFRPEDEDDELDEELERELAEETVARR